MTLFACGQWQTYKLELLASAATMASLRKLTKGIIAAKDEGNGKRRSPRIFALEEAHGSGSGSGSGSDHSKNSTPCMDKATFRTAVGATKKRKLRPLQQQLTAPSPLSPSNQALKHSHHQGVQNQSDQQLKAPYAVTVVPEKRILELVLDTLQRRDTYEIFAEPVDPNEVENYYAIIEEPMDFGTMRAKLHEGMYKSLEKFEHDVFLIFNNAMHFNSSGTIYFRQARAINELAKKVFDVLKTNPEKFELEFSETKRKVGRRNQGAFRDSTEAKSSEITIEVSSKSVPCSSRGTSNRKSFKANHGCSDIAKHVGGRDFEVPTGTVPKDSRRYNKSFEDDKRVTYSRLSLGEDESIFSTIYGKLKQLERVNQQQDVGYINSLMLFVKGLGPTAQNIAKRKLLGCEIRTAASTCAPHNLNTAVTSSQRPFLNHPSSGEGRGKMDLEIALGGETAYITDDKVEGTLLNATAAACSHSHKWWSSFPNQGFCSKDLNSSSSYDHHHAYNYSKQTGNKSFMLLDKSKPVNHEQLSVNKEVLGNSQTTTTGVLESRMENKCKFQSLPWLPLVESTSSNVSCFLQDKSQMQKSRTGDPASIEAAREISCSTSEAMKISKSDQTIPMPSSFVFNLPYLKTRLDQINSSEQYRFLQQDSSSNKRALSAQMSYFFIRNPMN